jgi:hypothetical protein
MLAPAAITLHYDMPTFSEMCVSLAIPLRSLFQTGTVSTPHTSGNCASPAWAHPHELSTCSATLIWPTTHCSLSAKSVIQATSKLSTMLTQCVFEPLIRNAFRWLALATVRIDVSHPTQPPCTTWNDINLFTASNLAATVIHNESHAQLTDFYSATMESISDYIHSPHGCGEILSPIPRSHCRQPAPQPS